MGWCLGEMVGVRASSILSARVFSLKQKAMSSHESENEEEGVEKQGGKVGCRIPV